MAEDRAFSKHPRQMRMGKRDRLKLISLNLPETKCQAISPFVIQANKITNLIEIVREETTKES
jgi:hypothetical protein